MIDKHNNSKQDMQENSRIDIINKDTRIQFYTRYKKELERIASKPIANKNKCKGDTKTHDLLPKFRYPPIFYVFVEEARSHLSWVFLNLFPHEVAHIHSSSPL